MSVYLNDPDVTLYHGDALDVLRQLPDESVDCVVTSPPYNWRPGVTLDPFIGSGTVAKVARDHQRHAIGIDLNHTYLELAARRLQQLSLLT